MGKQNIVNIHDAKTNLSRLIDNVNSGQIEEIIIARAGKPVARLTALAKPTIRLGLRDGKFKIPDDIDADNAKVAGAFEKSSLFPSRRRS